MVGLQCIRIQRLYVLPVLNVDFTKMMMAAEIFLSIIGKAGEAKYPETTKAQPCIATNANFLSAPCLSRTPIVENISLQEMSCPGGNSLSVQ